MKAIVRQWQQNFLRVEFLFSVLLVVLLAWWLETQESAGLLQRFMDGDRGKVYSALSAIFGSLLGFVIAAVAIVIGHAGSPRLAILHKAGQMETLWAVFTASMRALAGATIVAVVGLVFDTGREIRAPIVLLTVFSSVLASFRVMRTIWVLENVIRIAAGSRPKHAENQQ
jgi:carbon starvation protein CstA